MRGYVCLDVSDNALLKCLDVGSIRRVDSVVARVDSTGNLRDIR